MGETGSSQFVHFLCLVEIGTLTRDDCRFTYLKVYTCTDLEAYTKDVEANGNFPIFHK